MNARRCIGGICLGFCVAGAIWWGFAREPRYEGKPLSYWAERACVGENRAPPADSVVALRAIGQKGVPYMVGWIGRPPLAESPVPVQQFRRICWAIYGPRPSQDAVIAAFRVMGPQAKPAIPELSRLLDQRSNYRTSYFAERALAAIGPAAVPALTVGLGGAHPQVRKVILRDLGHMGTNSLEAIPDIIAFTASPDRGLRGEAYAALGLIGQKPELTIPLIRAGLADQDAAVRERAAMGLSGFGREASVLVPDLVNALSDADWMVRLAAVSSLVQISDGGDNVVELVAHSVGDSNRVVRRVVAMALGKFGTEQARNHLMGMTNDPDASVRGAAIQALRRLPVSAQRD